MVTHSGKEDVITGTTGEAVGLILHGAELACTFECIPEGDTIAITGASGSPAASAGLPPLGGQVVIAGMPTIVMDQFADALNTAASPSTKWIYTGGGSIKGESDSHWTMTIPLKRFYSIGSAGAVVP